MCTVEESISDSLSVDLGICNPDCHVHFHSIVVARFLFARWRVWADWTRASGVTQFVPISFVAELVVRPIGR